MKSEERKHSNTSAITRPNITYKNDANTEFLPSSTEPATLRAQGPQNARYHRTIEFWHPTGSEFGQFIADERAESPYERAAETLAKEALREALENLSYRERRVLELRYGLGGEHPRTLDEVGHTFNVTRERIRQIENRSLKKLQNLREVQKLRNDVEIASGFALRTRQLSKPPATSW